MITDPTVGELLDATEGESLGDWERANVREMRRDRAAARSGHLQGASQGALSAVVWLPSDP
jgi:hypothetical protein